MSYMPPFKNEEVYLDVRSKMKCFINSNDFFWLKQIREYALCESTDPLDYRFQVLRNYISFLKKNGYIHCSEVKGPERQYVVIKKIN